MSQAQTLKRRRKVFLRRRQRSDAMTLMEHLRELRKRLVASLLAFLALSVIAFFFYDPILAVIRRPFCSLDPSLLGPQGCDLVFVKVTGGFMFRLKVTAMAGMLAAAPIWLYQIWAFITPGLTAKEKKYALPFILSSITLFIGGSTLAYLSLPTGLRLLVTIGGEGLEALFGAEEYLNFVGLMLIGFGVLFELPLLLFFLGLTGVITVEQLRRQRKAAVVAIVALAAIVTPSQDPYTLLGLSVPLYLMYELTLVLLRVRERRRRKLGEPDRESVSV